MTNFKNSSRLFAVALSLLALAACSNTPPAAPAKPAGIVARPERLAFLCVAPGCTDSQLVDFTVNGNRRAAIKRIVIDGDTAGDFSFTPSEPPPFIVGANSGFQVTVGYVPKGAPAPGAVDLVITYTDASPDESADRLEAGELRVPLVRRVVGEPRLALAPASVSFGVVAPGTSKSVPVQLKNEGFGNVALEIGAAKSASAEVTVTLPSPAAMGPGATLDVPLVFAPTAPKYLKTTVTLTPTATSVDPGTVEVEGTSLAGPKLALEPSGDIDFGELPKGKKRTVVAKLVNQGGAPLTVKGLTVTDASKNLEAHLDDDTFPRTVAPLERVALTLTLDGTTPAEVAATLTVDSDDPDTKNSTVKIYGTVTEPQLTVSPAAIDFGTLALGWVERRPLELRNTGYGTLTVKNIVMVAGSSDVFTLQSLPTLPMTLKREQRVGLDVELRGETAATFAGSVSVETDDPVNPFMEVQVTGKVASCTATCTVANATPACTNGKCEIASCKSGFYDVNASAADGCECKEPSSDPGAFCSDAADKGTLKDNDKTQVTHSGIVPTGDDVDVIRFWAEDAFAFSENFKVKIRLDSADPGIAMCVYRHAGSHDSTCYFSNENCPTNRYYEKGGSAGGGDDADFIVKVYRTASSKPTCTPYTVFMSNGL